jgi:hypothetical protein
METLGVGIMNSTAFSLPANSNPKVDGNQISSKTADFQPHPPALTPIFMNVTFQNLNNSKIHACIHIIISIA